MKIAASEGPLVWSPDSKRLLAGKSEFSCKFALYPFDSLQAVDISTRRGCVIKSTSCVVQGFPVWLDWDP
jgi:hypothetical protein